MSAGSHPYPDPVPIYAYRDSTPTMWHHHLIIEGQRRGRRGLIAQPLYTDHVNWYVDYSHGIRLVSRRIRVDGKWMIIS